MKFEVLEIFDNTISQITLCTFLPFFLIEQKETKIQDNPPAGGLRTPQRWPAVLSSLPLPPSKDYLAFKLYGIYQEFPKY
ncbi:hypothetical protein [Marivirga tractuosa]|uniref:hypothetical protein n=1 Tax=Marivirga tractuosa TaxID=1006 RepID=UPI0002E2537E|nr:hypothetical protein [Marivirga tractuosa]